MSARPANEQAAGFIAVGGLPLIHVIVVIGTGQVQNTDFSLVLLPLLFAAVAWILCRALEVSKGWGAVYTLGCAGACWMAGVVVGLFDSLFLPW